jgi:tRNA pseudouridine55 synthase
VSEEAVRQALLRFVGEIRQVPSSVSAVKVAGRRAYQLARAGERVELEPRTVTVHSLEVTAVRRKAALLDVDLSVSCSSGTYIRAIARDLGAELGVGGHLSALRRTEVGPFTLADVRRSLDQMQAAGELDLVPLGAVAERVFPHVRVDEPAATDIGHGRRLRLTLPATGVPVALLGPDGGLLALYEQRDEYAVPVAVLV